MADGSIIKSKKINQINFNCNSNNDLADYYTRSAVRLDFIKLMNTVSDFKLNILHASATTKFNCFYIRQFHSILTLLYKANGDKYIGRWDGNGGGLGEIYYADGTQYTGHWH